MMLIHISVSNNLQIMSRFVFLNWFSYHLCMFNRKNPNQGSLSLSLSVNQLFQDLFLNQFSNHLLTFLQEAVQSSCGSFSLSFSPTKPASTSSAGRATAGSSSSPTRTRWRVAGASERTNRR